MMRRRTLVSRTLVVLAAAVLVPGCVALRRTPEARFFVLNATLGPAAQPPAVGGLVGLQPVRIPEHLARPQLVRWAAPNELRIDEFLRWSEPLDAAVERTLGENLATLLPQTRVLHDPWPAVARLRCRVAVELRLFGAQPDAGVRLAGRFALLAGREERALVQRPFAYSRSAPPPPAARPGPTAEVEAMSELLGELAAEIARAVAALPEPAAGQP